MTTEPQSRHRSYGRLRGRALRPRQKSLMDVLLPKIRIQLNEDELDPEKLFPGDDGAEIWLEIGFGGGEHLAVQAERHPEISFIGCEVFENGIAACLSHIEERALENVRIFPNDVRDLLSALKPQSLAKVFILFPDPWPKTSHHKRRLIQKETLDFLARVLKPGGTLVCASDEPSYIPWVQERLADHPEFSWENEGQKHTPLPGWVETRYERKAKREGRSPVYMLYRRS
ncbi:MAG: tRNA (guanosine(46)-N7)-methyltransferase TrmB [bacterium]|nr:tRNA (guanosine(46)-N7)-methyltransferase TrmB [bacterium]